jgi:hypothetical protein
MLLGPVHTAPTECLLRLVWPPYYMSRAPT